MAFDTIQFKPMRLDLDRSLCRRTRWKSRTREEKLSEDISNALKTRRGVTTAKKVTRRKKKSINVKRVHKSLKSLYAKSFKTVTMKLGSIAGQAKAIESRINTAIHLLSQTRMMVLRALEYFVMREVHRSDEVCGDDPLDLILDKAHGFTVVRNLITCFLDGISDLSKDNKKSKTKGRRAETANAKQAQELARSIYAGLCGPMGVFAGMKPLKGELKIYVSIAIQELGREIHTMFRTHFKRLPNLIEEKAKQIACQEEDDDDKNEDDDDGEDDMNEGDDDGDDDDKHVFSEGHIRACWKSFSQLPSIVQPVLCPTAGYSDAFLLLSETATIQLLWGDNSPVKRYMEQVCTKKQADKLAKDDYGALVVEIKQSHGAKALASYLKKWFEFCFQSREARSQSRDPPPLPQSPPSRQRYAISNMLRTNGLELQAIAFDTKRRYQSSKWRLYIPDIAAKFPDKEAVEEFEGDQGPAIVVGIDSGEVVPAAFCSLDP
ncbi:hypothetical protein BGZ65_003114 [Modicella reniformis]|uniref:Uncharacterized protein n=1 Tax=Modicella reniformis TaxID=1440133 RepID=A0A9P6SU41_9FUNG|nr:hypothetical protein BGZ65_003114 [Modicella reniformis]